MTPIRILAVLGLLGSAAAATAQDQPSRLCELRVWPARATSATTAGVLSNLGLPGVYVDRQNNRDANLRDQVTLIETLTPSTQALAAAELDLMSLFGMATGMVLFESDNLDLRSAPAGRDRLLPDTPPCYAELLVTVNEYRNSATRGKSLKTSFVFKDFRSDTLKSVSGSADSALRIFPAKDAAQENAARRDVTDAFVANLKDFAGQVSRKAR